MVNGETHRRTPAASAKEVATVIGEFRWPSYWAPNSAALPTVLRTRTQMTRVRPNFPTAGHWQASWIEPVEIVDGPSAHRPAYHLVGTHTINDPVASAFLHATAHGVYEAFINGRRVGDLELTPGFNAYRKRLQVHTFDVTNLLGPGENAIGALLSDGWWRGQHGVIREIDAYGPTTAFLAELHVTLRSGATIVWGTNPTWRSTPSHILAADLIAGEVHDLRRVVKGWAAPGTNRSAWDPVRVAAHGFAELCAPIGPPVRRIEELGAHSITQIGDSSHVVDFGQNSNGWVRLTDLGPVGTVSTLTYGEALNPDGTVTQANIADGAFAEHRDISFQTDTVISAGDGSTFEGRHSTKGFRYVGIAGHLGPIAPESITSIVVHTDLRGVGDFACSDERINRLHRAAVWSFRGNACDLPTDCPTRERSGWVGDWQLYVATAAFLYDVTDFSVKWLRDLAADQFADGRVTSIVPDPSPRAPIWGTTHGSSGWGDAAVHVPWELYLASGRTDFIATQLDSMRRWVDFAANRAATRRHSSRVERHAEARPHESYLWDSGWHFGEWLVPGDDMQNILGRLGAADHGIVATAYFYRSARELSQLAALVGETDTAERYGTLADHVLGAWRTEFLDRHGHVSPASQADLVRALAFGLVPDDLRFQTANDLVDLVHEADDHLGTGFLATPFLLPVLADAGHLDVAYALLLQDTEPSWLSMTENGATTIWEDWDGVSSKGVARHSLNHYSKGAVISFLHRYTAGLQLVEPGYRRFRVAPRPGGGITGANTYHDSPYGHIAVRWEIEGDDGTIEVSVPDATTGELVLPDGTSEELPPGVHMRTWNAAAVTEGPTSTDER